MIRRRRILILLALTGCAGQTSSGTTVPAPAPASATADSSRFLVPAGYGSLKQEDISLNLQVQTLQVRAVPMDETVIRVLSPDSYRALSDILASHRREIAEVGRRTGLHGFAIWYVQFFASEQGETRYSPHEFIVSSVGRDFRPIEVLALTPGFGEQRLRQRERKGALYLFDPQIDVNQPLIVQYETARTADWTSVLRRIERERVLVRSRAGIRR
jgi:hypothetical protein